MDKIVIDSYGKINLSLEVVGKRKDGYHNIETIMQEIDLKDRLEIRNNKTKKLNIDSNIKDLPRDESNLVYKAWEMMKSYSGIERGFDVYIEKNIPIAGGLAGGSSNAASMLKGINILWNLGYSRELYDLGESIGADVPFCLRGGTVYASGIGSILKDIPRLQGVNILLVNPNIPMDTARVYGGLKNSKPRVNFDMGDLVDGIENKDINRVSKNLYNRLEDVVFKEEPIVAKLKNDLDKLGSLGSLMSGSGTSVFGIFSSEENLSKAYNSLKKAYPEFTIIKTKTR